MSDNAKRAELKLHDLVKNMPMLPVEGEEFRALVEDIRERGITDPIRITAAREIVDGRHRWKAAEYASLENVPVEVVPDDQIAQVIIGSLVHRRHYNKSILAYLLVPLYSQLAEEAKKRRLANLRMGTIPRKHTECASGEIRGKGKFYHFSPTLSDEAERVHKIFQKNPDFQGKFEPKLMAGEIFLGGIIQAWVGREQYDLGQVNLDKRREYSRLAVKFLGKLNHQLSFFDKLTAPEKKVVGDVTITAIKEWPDEIKKQIYETLRTAFEK